MSQLFNKYIVQKSDGSPVDPKAQYFILRIDTDPAARLAMHVYAGFFKESDPQFASELLAWVKQYEGAPNTGLHTDAAKAEPYFDDSLPEEYIEHVIYERNRRAGKT